MTLNKTEGNTLIAEMTGWKYHCDKSRSKRWQHWWATDGIQYAGKEPPSFHLHWEFMHKVIDNIENLGFANRMRFYPNDNEDYKYCFEIIADPHRMRLDTFKAYSNESRIDACWECIVKFFQWYKTHKSQSNDNKPE